MKTSWHFEYNVRPHRAEARREDWIEAVLANPLDTVMQNNGRIRMWGFIPEAEKYMRVVLESDGETVHIVFFDRNYGKRRLSRPHHLVLSFLMS